MMGSTLKGKNLFMRANSFLYELIPTERQQNNSIADSPKIEPLFSLHTLKCLSIGTPKIINFPFVSNGKFMVFTCPNIQAYYNDAVLCLNFGTPENNEFSIWNKWKIHYF